MGLEQPGDRTARCEPACDQRSGPADRQADREERRLPECSERAQRCHCHRGSAEHTEGRRKRCRRAAEERRAKGEDRSDAELPRTRQRAVVGELARIVQPPDLPAVPPQRGQQERDDRDQPDGDGGARTRRGNSSHLHQPQPDREQDEGKEKVELLFDPERPRVQQRVQLLVGREVARRQGVQIDVRGEQRCEEAGQRRLVADPRGCQQHRRGEDEREHDRERR